VETEEMNDESVVWEVVTRNDLDVEARIAAVLTILVTSSLLAWLGTKLIGWLATRWTPDLSSPATWLWAGVAYVVLVVVVFAALIGTNGFLNRRLDRKRGAEE
jgi:hypothetical protein